VPPPLPVLSAASPAPVHVTAVPAAAVTPSSMDVDSPATRQADVKSTSAQPSSAAAAAGSPDVPSASDPSIHQTWHNLLAAVAAVNLGPESIAALMKEPRAAAIVVADPLSPEADHKSSEETDAARQVDDEASDAVDTEPEPVSSLPSPAHMHHLLEEVKRGVDGASAKLVSVIAVGARPPACFLSPDQLSFIWAAADTAVCDPTIRQPSSHRWFWLLWRGLCQIGIHCGTQAIGELKLQVARWHALKIIPNQHADKMSRKLDRVADGADLLPAFSPRATPLVRHTTGTVTCCTELRGPLF
jgi:hypothetical protein